MTVLREYVTWVVAFGRQNERKKIKNQELLIIKHYDILSRP